MHDLIVLLYASDLLSFLTTLSVLVFVSSLVRRLGSTQAPKSSTTTATRRMPRLEARDPRQRELLQRTAAKRLPQATRSASNRADPAQRRTRVGGRKT